MIESMTNLTTIKLSKETRDRLKAVALPGETQFDTLTRALDALERHEFKLAAAKIELTEDYLDETREWMNAVLTATRRPE